MGVVTAKSKLAAEHCTATEAGFHRCWYPVARVQEIAGAAVIGRDFLGTRVVVWRDPAGKPVVQGAWCPHLGADLSLGKIVDGLLRCPYHHWSFEAGGSCAKIPSGDKIPAAARVFTYPSAEAWGLVWAFNGERADFPPPRIPDAEEGEIVFETFERGRRSWDSWVAVSNGVDFQHLQTLHGLPRASMPDQLDVDASGIEFRVESPYHLQAGRISGTNTFAQHLRMGPPETGQHMFMLFAGAPIEPGSTMGYFVAGVPQAAAAKLGEVAAMMNRLNEEDAPVLNTIRFRRGLLTASDRHLARYFKYADEFPTFLPPA